MTALNARHVGVDELYGAWRRGEPVVDVREPDEFAQARVPGALNVPLQTVPAALADLPAHRPVWVVCAVGVRSEAAADFLVRAGVEAVTVDGGTAAWAHAGHPLDAG